MDRHRIRRQRPAVPGRDEKSGPGAEALERGDVLGTPDVIDDQKHPLAVQLLAEVRAGGGDGLEGRRVLFRPPADQVADPGQAAGGVDLLAHGGPEDAVGILLADLLVVAELDRQSGLAESAGAVDGRGDAHGRGAAGAPIQEQGVPDLRVLAALDERLPGRGHAAVPI